MTHTEISCLKEIRDLIDLTKDSIREMKDADILMVMIFIEILTETGILIKDGE